MEIAAVIRVLAAEAAEWWGAILSSSILHIVSGSLQNDAPKAGGKKGGWSFVEVLLMVVLYVDGSVVKWHLMDPLVSHACAMTE